MFSRVRDGSAVAFSVLMMASSCSWSTLTEEGATPALSGVQENSFRSLPGRYIVTMKEPTPSLGNVASAMALSSDGQLGRIWPNAVRGFEIAKLTPTTVQSLRNDPRVLAVEPVGTYKTLASQSLYTSNGEWGLDVIDQRSLTRNFLFNYFFTGSGVHLYVVDSGVDTSQAEFKYGLTVGTGYQTGPWTGPYEDHNMHGTQVASIAVGGTVGVARNAILHSVRVGYGEPGEFRINIEAGDLLDGLEWIASNGQRPGVVNISIGRDGEEWQSSFITAVNSLLTSGYTVVLGAGNSASEACSLKYGGPSGLKPEAIVVGAMTLAGGRKADSNYGACLDLFAPGEGLRVANPEILGGGYRDDIGGTSVAAPFVSGVAAAILGQRSTFGSGTVASVLVMSATSGLLNPATLGTGSPNLLLNSLHRTFFFTGPNVINSFVTHSATWGVDPVGGDGNWTYQWYESKNGAPQTLVSTSRYYTRVITGGEYHLALTVNATSFGETVTGTYQVEVNCGGC